MVYLDYPIRIEGNDLDGWGAAIDDLNVVAAGDTREEAVELARAAAVETIDWLKAEGREVPQPSTVTVAA